MTNHRTDFNTRALVTRGLRVLDLLAWERRPISSSRLIDKYKEHYDDLHPQRPAARRTVLRMLKALAEDGWIVCVRCGHQEDQPENCPHLWKIGTISLKIVEYVEQVPVEIPVVRAVKVEVFHSIGGQQ